MTLPEWDIEQERYWQVTTANSVLEYIVYSCTLVEENFKDILFWKSLSVFIREKSMIWCALQLKKYFKIFILENFVCFHLWEEYDLMHCLLLDEMFWLMA